MRFLLAAGIWTMPLIARAEAFRKGPYLQAVTPSGVTVMWESDEPLAGRVVVHSPIEPDRVVEAPLPTSMHEVVITGLAPGRRYAYVVECGAERGGGEFATASATVEPFSFIVFGDSRSNPDAHRAVVERVRREVPDFILGTGDMVNEGVNERDWQTFFAIERELLRDNVLFPSLGNHDRDRGAQRPADTYRKYFSLPADSPDPERYYAFTYGNSRFLMLDSNSASFALTDQTAWIEGQLRAATADTTVRHVFVAMHHPPFSTSLHGGQPQLREMWAPVFARYQVDAVFSGHDHTYERSEVDGVRYFVSGGGGAPLYPRDSRPANEDLLASVYFERTFNYLRLQVVGGFVEVAAFRNDGSLIEGLGWNKGEPRPPSKVAEIRQKSPPPAALVAGATPRASAPAVGGCCAKAGGRTSIVWMVVALAVLSRLRLSRRS